MVSARMKKAGGRNNRCIQHNRQNQGYINENYML